MSSENIVTLWEACFHSEGEAEKYEIFSGMHRYKNNMLKPNELEIRKIE